MLCNACQSIFSSVSTSPRGFWKGIRPRVFLDVELDGIWAGSHHVKRKSFVLAVKKSCYICSTIFRDCTSQMRQLAAYFRIFYQLRLVQDSATESEHAYDLNFTIELLERQEPFIQSQCFDCSGTFKILPRTVIEGGVKTAILTRNAFSVEWQELIRSWLNNCDMSHEKCQVAHQKPRKYPARLLCVAGEGQVYLRKFGSNTAHPQYVTMSHRWAPDIPITLTDTTEHALIEGISTAELPQRFQDAIAVTRWMKIDYIWIDALCIMQNSDRDRRTQTAILNDIFTHSYCNIAATSAEPIKGFFIDRTTSIAEPYPIARPGSSNSAPTHLLGYDDLWSNNLLDSHLHNRAWALQERLLSRRTIHFGQDQMFWECRSDMACESYPGGIPSHFRNCRTAKWRLPDPIISPHTSNWIYRSLHPPFGWQRVSGRLNSLRETIDHDSSSQQRARINEIWSKTVEHYMTCKLTVNSDKLVAISGIAASIAAITHERYLAGLWHNATLPESLLWYVIRRRKADGSSSVRIATEDRDGHQAPSWSWASLDAEIAWNLSCGYDRLLIKILSATVQTVDGGWTGKILSAAMKIEGSLAHAHLQIMGRRQDGQLQEDGRYSLQPKVVMQQQFASDVTKPPTMEPMIYLDTPLLPDCAEVEVSLLPVCMGWKGRTGNDWTALAGLLLKRVPLLHPEIMYARIGIFGLDETQAKMLFGAENFGAVPRSLSNTRLNTITLV